MIRGQGSRIQNVFLRGKRLLIECGEYGCFRKIAALGDQGKCDLPKSHQIGRRSSATVDDHAEAG
jgi:hypothetical protein